MIKKTPRIDPWLPSKSSRMSIIAVTLAMLYIFSFSSPPIIGHIGIAHAQDPQIAIRILTVDPPVGTILVPGQSYNFTVTVAVTYPPPELNDMGGITWENYFDLSFNIMGVDETPDFLSSVCNEILLQHDTWTTQETLVAWWPYPVTGGVNQIKLVAWVEDSTWEGAELGLQSDSVTFNVEGPQPIHGVVEDGHGNSLDSVKVTLTWDSTDDGTANPEIEETVYTDRNGAYSISHADIRAPMQGTGILEVALESEDTTVKLFDVSAGAAGLAYPISARFPFTLSAEADLNQDLTFPVNAQDDRWPTSSSATPNLREDHLDDNAAIYFYIMQAARFAEDVLGMNMLITPIQVMTYGNGGTYFSPTDRIFIGTEDSDYGHPDMPDNREWHEFSHYIMYEAYGSWPFVAADNDPTHPSENHDGYKNPSTSDSYTEGFAEFMSCLIAEHYGDPNPQQYANHANFEVNYVPLTDRGLDEEFAVATLLWDIHDTPGHPSDWGDRVTKSTTEMWGILKTRRNTMKDIYDAFRAAYPDEATAIDNIFVAHGFFADENEGNHQHDDREPYWDANWNGRYDTGEDFIDIGEDPQWSFPWHEYNEGEDIGRAADFGRPTREGTPKRSGAYLMVDTVAGVTSAAVDDITFTVEMNFASPYENYDYEFTTTFDKDYPNMIYLQMPPEQYNVEATITALSPAHGDSQPYTMESATYWDSYYDPDNPGYVAGVTLYLGSDQEPVSTISQTVRTAQLTGVTALSSITPGETLSVTLTVDYEFSESTTMGYAVHDYTLGMWNVLEEVTLVGEGVDTFTIEIDAPNEEKTWLLEAGVMYVKDGEWDSDESGWTQTFEVQISSATVASWSAQLTSVEAPAEVAPGETFDVSLTVVYAFTEATEMSPGLYDPNTGAWVAEEYETLQGSGSKTYTFQLTAPTQTATWTLDASSWYKADGIWSHDEAGWSETLVIPIASSDTSLTSSTLQLYSVSHPQAVDPGETFQIEATTVHTFTLSSPDDPLTYIYIGVWNPSLEAYIAEAEDQVGIDPVQGTGDEYNTYTLTVTAPDEPGRWELSVQAHYWQDNQWKKDPENYYEALTIEVVGAETETGTLVAVGVDAPTSVYAGSSFAVEAQVTHSFILGSPDDPLKTIHVGIYDTGTGDFISESSDEVGIDPIQSVSDEQLYYTFYLTAPSSAGDWELTLITQYQDDGEWRHNAGEYAHPFTVEVLAETTTDPPADQDTNDPPVSRFTFTPSEPTEGDTVNFDAGDSYDTDGEIVDYIWYIYGEADDSLQGSPSWTWRDAQTGIIEISLATIDDDGETSEIYTKMFEVIPKGPDKPDGIPGFPLSATLIGLIGGALILSVLRRNGTSLT